MIDYDVIEKDFNLFVDRNARTYNKSREYIKETPIAKEYWNYLIEREKDKLKNEN